VLELRVMRLASARQWFLVVLSALLQIAMFPIAGPLPAWRAALCWIALVPWLVAMLRDEPGRPPMSVRHAALMGYVCGILWYMGNCCWIYQTMHIYGALPGPVAFAILILFALYLGLYHALFAALVVFVRRSTFGIRGALLVAPCVWVALELARARITFFPWDLLGYTQVDNLFVTGLAQVGGVMAISFVIAAINAAIVPFFIRTGWPRLNVPVVAFVMAISLQLSRFEPTLKPLTHTSGEQVAVLMQENIEVGAAGRESDALSLAQELDQFSADSLHPSVGVPIPGGKLGWGSGTPSNPTAVIVWPEAPSHFMSNDESFRTGAGQLATLANAPVIAGALGVDRSTSSARGYYLYDSAALFNAAGEYIGRYDKIHLVPWGEYVPFKQFFAFADKLTEGVGDMDRGSERKVFSIGGHRYGIFICYESIFGDEIRQFALNDAEVLVNISDDGWYGDSGAPWQHLNMARMRAIENRRWLLRSTNTGITTAIDPQGRVFNEAPRHVRGAFAFSFAFAPAKFHTLYARRGDWLARLCAIITLAVLAVCRLIPAKAKYRGSSLRAE
jgi:apolipoprotein N-acyltransferase